LRDPRTVEDWYGLTPFALADANVQGDSLKQVGRVRADTQKAHASARGSPLCWCGCYTLTERCCTFAVALLWYAWSHALPTPG
jgi:hypothetical protein